MKSLTSLYKGFRYEAMARRFLAEQKFSFVAKNYRTKLGEIDLIMRDGETLVFVEVKYRSHESHGHVLETVTPAKQAKLRKTAMQYIALHIPHGEPSCRFDVIGIMIEDKMPKIHWVKNAF